MTEDELALRRVRDAGDVDVGGWSLLRPPPGRKTLTMQLAPAVQPRIAATVQRREVGGEPAATAAELAAWPLVAAPAPVNDDGDARAVAAHGVAGGGGALPFEGELRRSFGRHAAALDGVRVHDDARAAGAARAIGADAYATGADIALAAPATRELIAHEAAHVVQQRGGVALSGGVGRAGDPYEQHADEVGAAFAAGRSVEALLDRFAPAAPAASGGAGAAVQRREHGHHHNGGGGGAPASGVASDSRDGDGAAFDVRARILDLQVAGGACLLRLDAGAKKGVRREMSGYLYGDGAVVLELEIIEVAPDHSRARVEASRRDVEVAHSVVINPAAGVPQVKVPPARDLHTHVIDVSVDGGGTRVTLAGGADRGVATGMSVVLSGGAGRPVRFTIEEVQRRTCRGHAATTVDGVTAHPQAIVNPTSVA